MIWKTTGASYSGDWKRGLRHGFGSDKYADGGRYAGYFSSGNYNGFGTKYAADGSILYQGQWKDGKPLS